MVVLSRGQLPKGISLVGGRSRGLFILSTRPGTITQGLQTGDQLIKVPHTLLYLFHTMSLSRIGWFYDG